MKLSYLVGASLCLSICSAAFADSTTPPPPPLTTIVMNDESESLLADSNGKTLYVFDADLNQAMPTCVGDCAEQWPPYILTTDEATNLVAPLGKIMRANHKMQLTYNGRAVYTYGFDRIRGDDMGDGIGNVWHYIVIPPAK